MVTIEARNLSKKFRDFTAVDGVSFEVRSGEIFGFLGPNGSGKTTTIRMTLGLLSPTSGSAEVLGIPVDEEPAAIRVRVGYMAQRFSLYNDLTVEQNLRFYGRAYGLRGLGLEQSMARAVHLSGLEGNESARTGELAGGWRQRLALSAAILHEPEVVFLDEPTAGVDPVSRREFWELLYRLVGAGVTVFVTTHYMDEAEHCHRLAFIQRGELIAMGSPAEIKREHMTSRVVQLESAQPSAALTALKEAALERHSSVEHVELYGSALRVHLREEGDPESALERLLEVAGVPDVTVRAIEPSLEDVFIECMR